MTANGAGDATRSARLGCFWCDERNRRRLAESRGGAMASSGSDLSKRRCVPCEGGAKKLAPAEVKTLFRQLDGWQLHEDRLRKMFEFKDFVSTMAFVDEMAEIAEAEGHHPDFCVHYSRVIVFLWTHALGGLSENDFVLA